MKLKKILKRNAEYLKLMVKKDLQEKYPEKDFLEWDNFLEGLWIQTLSRILLKIQDYQHGGALLITECSTDLDVKYSIRYERLTLAMRAFAKASIDAEVLEENIYQEFEKGKRAVSKNLYHFEAQVLNYKKATAEEITGSVSFVASQSCVDGVVLLNSNMVVNGFGAVLKSKKMPNKIYVSSTATASPKSLVPHDPKHYGTRHRSMIAYCWKHPGSLGLVVSQDGDIRAFCKIEDKLIMWENIKTQQYMTNRAQKNRAWFNNDDVVSDNQSQSAT